MVNLGKAGDIISGVALIGALMSLGVMSVITYKRSEDLKLFEKPAIVREYDLNRRLLDELECKFDGTVELGIDVAGIEQARNFYADKVDSLENLPEFQEASVRYKTGLRDIECSRDKLAGGAVYALFSSLGLGLLGLGLSGYSAIRRNSKKD